jgi:hypothetical protein
MVNLIFRQGYIKMLDGRWWIGGKEGALETELE